MFGANDLKGGWLQGKYLLNLDNEDEGELCVGCAGGIDTTATFAYQPVETEEGDIALRIELKGLKGGHSGCDIHLQRGNAIKLLVRVLKDAVANYEARLASIDGGSLRNAIPREASAVITIPADSYQDLQDMIDRYEDLYLREYAGVDDGITLKATEVECPKTEIPEEIQDCLIHALTLCPHGVYRMIPERPDVVETSNNLAMVKTVEGKVTCYCLTRSSVESRKEELQSIIQSAFSLGVRRGRTRRYHPRRPGVWHHRQQVSGYGDDCFRSDHQAPALAGRARGDQYGSQDLSLRRGYTESTVRTVYEKRTAKW